MAKVYVTRKMHFNAAHRLHNPSKSDEWNHATYGKCNSPNWHGHNYVLEITVAGEPDPDTGYVVDLGHLKKVVEDRVISKLDHSNLNLDVDFMKGILPSTENLAIQIWKQVEPLIPAGSLHSVRLRETDNNSAEYRGD
jgi:6-pyruvoyltetrahydropterin/6-carboxytetrahydropterin synthase